MTRFRLAALAMQESVRRYADAVRVARAMSNDLQLDYAAVGQATHLASRMEQLARPGSILLTADTLRLAEGYVVVKPMGLMQIKGLGSIRGPSARGSRCARRTD